MVNIDAMLTPYTTAKQLKRSPELVPWIEAVSQELVSIGQFFNVPLGFAGLLKGTEAEVNVKNGKVLLGAELSKVLSENALRFVLAHEAGHVWTEALLEKMPEFKRPPQWDPDLLLAVGVFLGLLGWALKSHWPALGYGFQILAGLSYLFRKFVGRDDRWYWWNEVQADWAAACVCGKTEALAAISELRQVLDVEEFEPRRHYLEMLFDAQEAGQPLEVPFRGTVYPVFSPASPSQVGA